MNRFQNGTKVLAGAFLLSFFPGSTALAMSVSVVSSNASPLPVAELVTFSADVSEAPEGPVWYRMRVRGSGSPGWQTVVDYGIQNQFEWTASEREGQYEIEVAARNLGSGETASTVVPFVFLARADSDPVITRTQNPLVFLYSAAPCRPGSSMAVTVIPATGTSPLFTTPLKPCVSEQTMNFYLAGLKQFTSYTVQHTVLSSNGDAFSQGPPMTLDVGSVSPFLGLPERRVLTGSSDRVWGVLLQSSLFLPTIATDLAGDLIWYYPGEVSFLTRPSGAGRFWGIYQPVAERPEKQIVREFDLAGMTLAQTNAARINEQLAEKGVHPITSFHHEAFRLPDGRVVVLAAWERPGAGGPASGGSNLIGDTILVLGRDLEVLWVWDAFDHLPTAEKATLGEVCTPTGAGCPPFYESAEADDWLHGNSLQIMPDGSILYSSRHQDALLKIDFGNGLGDGAVLWRLGRNGEFRMDGGSSADWFSHQHDGKILSDGSTLVVYDNGNWRRDTDPGAHSRGQVYRLDEARRAATLVVNADLGVYSSAVGAAQALPGGTYQFSSGFVPGAAGLTTRIAEVDSEGRIVYEMEIETADYRSFRMPSLYGIP